MSDPNVKTRDPLPWAEARATARNPEDVKSSFTPIMRLAAEHQRATLCLAIAIVVPLIALFFVGKAVRDARAPQTTFAVDGSGTIHIGPLESINPDSVLFREAVILMAQVHMGRNPDGLALPELAERLYSDEALKQLKAEPTAEADLFKRRNYYQTVELVAIEPLEWGVNGKPKYRVKGYVLRNGIVDGLSQRDGPFYFRLSYELVANPKVGERGQYPFKVARYRLSWTDNRYEALPADKAGTDGPQ